MGILFRLELDLIDCDFAANESKRELKAQRERNGNILNGFVMSTLLCALFEGYFSDKFEKKRNVSDGEKTA